MTLTGTAPATRRVVWQNDVTRQATVHCYSGTTLSGWSWLNSVGNVGWSIAGIADFDHNGTTDLVWQNDITRQVTVHYYSGAVMSGWGWVSSAGTPGWKIAGVY